MNVTSMLRPCVWVEITDWIESRLDRQARQFGTYRQAPIWIWTSGCLKWQHLQRNLRSSQSVRACRSRQQPLHQGQPEGQSHRTVLVNALRVERVAVQLVDDVVPE